MSGFETEYTMKIGTREVSFAILPIDVFSGQPSLPNLINIWIEGIHVPPIVKRDGHHAFFNLPEKIYRVHIDSKVFFPEVIAVDMASLDKQNPVIQIRVIPNRKYEVARHVSVVIRQIKPFADVFARTMDEDTGIKLISYEEKDEKAYVRLYSDHAWQPLYKELAVFGEGGEAECFAIEAATVDGQYLVSQRLEGQYARGASLYPIARGRADETGYLFMPLKNMEKEKVILWEWQ